MRKFVHLSMVLLLLSIASTAVCPLVAQEPVAVEEAEAEVEEGEHAVVAEDAAAAVQSTDRSDQAPAPGAKNNTQIALLLTGMILFFAVGAVAIRRL